MRTAILPSLKELQREPYISEIEDSFLIWLFCGGPEPGLSSQDGMDMLMEPTARNTELVEQIQDILTARLKDFDVLTDGRSSLLSVYAIAPERVTRVPAEMRPAVFRLLSEYVLLKELDKRRPATAVVKERPPAGTSRPSVSAYGLKIDPSVISAEELENEIDLAISRHEQAVAERKRNEPT